MSIEPAKKMESQEVVIQQLEEMGIRVEFRPVAIFPLDNFGGEKSMDIYQALERVKRVREMHIKIFPDAFRNR